jgi:hypothetical protein
LGLIFDEVLAHKVWRDFVRGLFRYEFVRHMKQLQITCDGCDMVEHVEVSLSASASDGLNSKGWETYRAETYEANSQAREIFADLCPRCAARIRQLNHPANWPWTPAPPSRATASRDRDGSQHAPRRSVRKTDIGHENLFMDSAPSADHRRTTQSLTGAGDLRPGLDALDAVIRKA